VSDRRKKIGRPPNKPKQRGQIQRWGGTAKGRLGEPRQNFWGPREQNRTCKKWGGRAKNVPYENSAFQVSGGERGTHGEKEGGQEKYKTIELFTTNINPGPPRWGSGSERKKARRKGKNRANENKTHKPNIKGGYPKRRGVQKSQELIRWEKTWRSAILVKNGSGTVVGPAEGKNRKSRVLPKAGWDRNKKVPSG